MRLAVKLESHCRWMIPQGWLVWARVQAEMRDKQANAAREVVGLSQNLAERRCEPKALRMGAPVHGCVWREKVRAETWEK